MKRRCLFWPLALALTTLLSACAKVPTRKINPSDQSGANLSGGMTTIRVLARQDAALDAAISAYYERHPNIRIEKVPPSLTAMHMMDAIKLRVKAGDVDLVPIDDPDRLVKDGLIMPLDPLVQKNRFDLKPYGPGIDQLRVDGKLYELPFALTPLVITYNADLFAAAGVPGPAPGWTWDQFRQTAQRLSNGAGDRKQWGFAPSPGDFSILLLWLGGKAGDARLTRVDEKAVGEALQYFSTLTFTDQSIPVADLNGRGYFEEGTAGMGLAPFFGLDSLNHRNVAPTPSFPGTAPHVVAYPDSYGIAATSKNTEVAFDFLQFLAGPEGAITTARAGEVSAYRTPEAKQAFLDRKPTPPVGVASLFDQSWSIVPRGGLDSPDQKRLDALGNAAKQTLSGSMPWDAALADYKRSIDQIEN